MAENGNSTLEMGTSDQVLVATKRRKNLTYIIGGVAMLVVIGVVVALVVVLTGNDGGTAEEIVGTTEGPSSVLPPSPTTPTPGTTITVTPPPVTSPVTDPSTTEPPEDLIELEDIVSGVFSSPAFNGSWASGSEILLRSANGDLVMYNVDTDSTMALVPNTSQILQQASRVISLSPNRNHVVLSYNVEPVYRHSFVARYSSIDIVSGAVTDIVPPGANATEDFFLQTFLWGPTGTAHAFVYRNNIFFKASLASDPVQITTNGEENVVYNGIPDWVYEEEVFSSNQALWFTADGTRLAFATFDDTEVRIMRVPHYGVPGSVYYQYTQHHEIRYPKPGTTNPTVYVTIRDLASTTSTVFPAPSYLDQPILKSVRFVTNETIANMWTNRVQTELSVELCTLGNSTCNQIYQYTEPEGWIENIPILFNAEGSSFITILPRLVNGVLLKQIVQVSQVGTETNTPWIDTRRTSLAHTVLDILAWTNNDIVWYQATHVDDSAEQHIYTVNVDGDTSCFTCNIQREDGGLCLFNEATLSTNENRIFINCAGPDVPQLFIYDTNGTLALTWESNAETVALLSNRILPQIIRMQVPVAPGFPDADVQIQVPSDYASRTNVPLLVYVYGGPDSSVVTKQWGIDWGTSLVSRWNIAVAHIDGRGSGLRGVANTFAVNRRLGSVEIEDQINVTRYLQDNLPWLDSNRTCIWGWSYGGYASSMALARGGDVFRCAMAVVPVVDWRFYDSIYTERYMGTPQNNTQAYVESSLLTEETVEAYRRGRYFLVHGTADDNVHYQNAMLISRLLQRRDVHFTQMTYTDEDHSLVGVRPHLYHTLEKFLQDNLL